MAICFLLKIASSLRLVLGLACDAARHDVADTEDSGEKHADDTPLEWLSHIVLFLSCNETSEDDGETSTEDSKNKDVHSVSWPDIAGSISHWHF